MTATVRLGDLFDPVAGVLPSGVLALDSLNDTTALTFTDQTDYAWNDADLRFTIQGQKWLDDWRASIPSKIKYGAAKQVSTPRVFSAPAFGFTNNFFAHVTEFEFVFTGTQLSIVGHNLGGDGGPGVFGGDNQYGGDCQVYIEYGGRMWKAKQHPLTTIETDGSASYRDIVFNQPYHGRIRVVMGAMGFRWVRTDGASIIAPSPPRYFGIADGDSFFEPSQCLCADSVTQWFSTSIIDYLFELTGFSWARRGQGATGFFSNGTGLAFTDTTGSSTVGIPGMEGLSISVGGLSRYLSASRWDWMTRAAEMVTTYGNMGPFIKHDGEDFGQPPGKRPLVYLLNGTWNDASAGGVTEAQMYARAKYCYELVHNTDPYCLFAHVSPEPFDDDLFGDTVGPPTAGDKSDLHRQGQMRAAAEVGRVRYINAFGPDPETRWWTGAGPNPEGGSQGVPTDSQQAQLCSVVDGIHYQDPGGFYIANKITDGLAEMPAPAGRVNGFN